MGPLLRAGEFFFHTDLPQVPYVGVGGPPTHALSTYDWPRLPEAGLSLHVASPISSYGSQSMNPVFDNQCSQFVPAHLSSTGPDNNFFTQAVPGVAGLGRFHQVGADVGQLPLGFMNSITQPVQPNVANDIPLSIHPPQEWYDTEKLAGWRADGMNHLSANVADNVNYLGVADELTGYEDRFSLQGQDFSDSLAMPQVSPLAQQSSNTQELGFKLPSYGR